MLVTRQRAIRAGSQCVTLVWNGVVTLADKATFTRGPKNNLKQKLQEVDMENSQPTPRSRPRRRPRRAYFATALGAASLGLAALAVMGGPASASGAGKADTKTTTGHQGRGRRGHRHQVRQGARRPEGPGPLLRHRQQTHALRLHRRLPHGMAAVGPAQGPDCCAGGYRVSPAWAP